MCQHFRFERGSRINGARIERQRDRINYTKSVALRKIKTRLHDPSAAVEVDVGDGAVLVKHDDDIIDVTIAVAEGAVNRSIWFEDAGEVSSQKISHTTPADAHDRNRRNSGRREKDREVGGVGHHSHANK